MPSCIDEVIALSIRRHTEQRSHNRPEAPRVESYRARPPTRSHLEERHRAQPLAAGRAGAVCARLSTRSSARTTDPKHRASSRIARALPRDPTLRSAIGLSRWLQGALGPCVLVYPHGAALAQTDPKHRASSRIARVLPRDPTLRSAIGLSRWLQGALGPCVLVYPHGAALAQPTRSTARRVVSRASSHAIPP